MTEVKRPGVKAAEDGVDPEHVKMFTHIGQSTLANETNLSGVTWAYVCCSSESISTSFSAKMFRERRIYPLLLKNWSPSVHTGSMNS